MALSNKTFRDLEFPPTYKYSSDSDHIPLEFYLDVFPVAKEIDLLLGYFSTNAFKVLASGFAQFIHNGGSLRIVTNHMLSSADKKNLLESDHFDDEDKIINLFDDVDRLRATISKYGQHFFDCLKYLKSKGRLKIIPVKFNGVDLAHCKKMILYDGKDFISTDGSINFTLSALTKNSESFEVNAPWEGPIFKRRIENEKENFEKIISGNHPSYKHLNVEEVETVIDALGRNKEEDELINDSLSLDFSEMAKKVKQLIRRKQYKYEFETGKANDTPQFPYETGPRDYQRAAYEKWCENGHTGVFAMATGTGKTITSLNCLLQESKKTEIYKAIILVPSIALLNQWVNEVEQFNFKNILKVGGGNNWEKDLAGYVSNLSWGLKKDIVIISTYGSFVTNRFQKYFQKIQHEFTLIADEAHNMGASQMKNLLPSINVPKRIALSATPKRIYDPEGTDAIDTFFNDKPPYVYSFSMERALKEERLSEYKYFPKIVTLQDDELENYVEISKKLLRYFDSQKGEFRNDPAVEKLLLLRKNIIHKARNKVDCFKNIVKELRERGQLKYIFTYVPEGYVYDDVGDGERMLNHFMRGAVEVDKDLKINSYTAEEEDLEDILYGFSEGKIDMIFAMKMLDEGVDVPRTEVGIFCSSTGNPRQFIQRRGRLLRKHPDKTFATIYDMVVIPGNSIDADVNFNLERSLVRNELMRVAHFASLSMNYYDSRSELDHICERYELNLDQIIEML